MSERIEGSEQNNHQSPHGPENTTKADLDEDISQQSMPNGIESYEAKNRWKKRFEVNALVLATLMLATSLLQEMATSSYSILRLVAFPCALFLASYGYQWVVYFSDGQTQRKQAYFNVRNMLETYQPNRNTEKARLFQPESPTPNVKAIATIPLSRNGQNKFQPESPTSNVKAIATIPLSRNEQNKFQREPPTPKVKAIAAISLSRNEQNKFQREPPTPKVKAIAAISLSRNEQNKFQPESSTSNVKAIATIPLSRNEQNKFQPESSTSNVKAIATIPLSRNGQNNNHAHGINNGNNAAAQECRRNFLDWRNQRPPMPSALINGNDDNGSSSPENGGEQREFDYGTSLALGLVTTVLVASASEFLAGPSPGPA